MLIIDTFKDSRVKFYQNDQNYERCYSRNKGISLSEGKYILFLDSDDYFELDHLQNWYNYLQTNFEDKTFFIGAKKIKSNSNLELALNPTLNEHPVSYFFYNAIFPGQVCIPTELAKKHSFRTDMLVYEDAALWMELSCHNKVKFNNISSFVYCLHDDNTININKNNAYLFRLNAIRILLSEGWLTEYVNKDLKRSSLNSCYLGIIRFHKINSSRIQRIYWVILALILYPEYSFKNKLLMLLESIPFIDKFQYFKNRTLY
jgi:glycosyltransferase involved in cell wall biosynthesis